MEFRIADTFTDSLARLPVNEQKAAKTAAFDLQTDPSRPGLRLHRVDSVWDRNFWSARAVRDLRIIVHRTSSSFLICYVGHHDQAYRWAERRKLERHPRTGAAQLVEIREIVRQVETPYYVQPRPDAVTAGVEDTVARESSTALVSPEGREAAAERAGPVGAQDRAVQRLIFAENR